VSAILWLLYAVWEYNIPNGTLCDKDCNIRVDLVVIGPILLIATLYARSAYLRPEGQQPIVGWLLGAAGLVMVALGFVLFGYTAPAVVAGVAALAMAGYAIKSRFAATQTSSISS
jgi:hypothetical protein